MFELRSQIVILPVNVVEEEVDDDNSSLLSREVDEENERKIESAHDSPANPLPIMPI